MTVHTSAKKVHAEITVDRGGHDVRLDVSALVTGPPDRFSGVHFEDLEARDDAGAVAELTELEEELAVDALSLALEDDGAEP